MKQWRFFVLGGVVFLLPGLLAFPLMLLSGAYTPAARVNGVRGVPEQYTDVVMRAGSLCEGITPPLIAAQADHESAHTWDPTITSPAGATGIAQFMPATWTTQGKDGDGDGQADITNGIDSIWSQGHYMCTLAATIDSWLHDGIISGERISLTLAAYNAGAGAVRSWGGIPPYDETRTYVQAIQESAEKFAQAPTSTDSTLLNQARSHLGVPYVWGGSTPTGLDCSGLIVLSAAETGKPFPPTVRTADQIIHSPHAPAINYSDLQAGDIIGFSSAPSSYVHHIGIYAGTDESGHPLMIHAPDVGGVVEEVRLDTPYWQSMTWHPARLTT